MVQGGTFQMMCGVATVGAPSLYIAFRYRFLASRVIPPDDFCAQATEGCAKRSYFTPNAEGIPWPSNRDSVDWRLPRAGRVGIWDADAFTQVHVDIMLRLLLYWP